MTSSDPFTESERELLLEQYTELREEVRLTIQQQNRRVLSAIAAIGAIAGYSLLRGNPWLLAFVPVVICVIFIQTINSHRYLSSNARHLVDIESELTDITPLFCWESKYGGMFGSEPTALRSRGPGPLTWATFLEYAMLLIVVPLYFFAIAIGYYSWDTRPEKWAAFDETWLLVGYGFMTGLCVFIGILGLWHFQAVSGEQKFPQLRSVFGTVRDYASKFH